MSEIWSLGVLLYELCALKPPFNSATLNKIAKMDPKATSKLEIGEIPAHFSEDVKKLIFQLLSI